MALLGGGIPQAQVQLLRHLHGKGEGFFDVLRFQQTDTLVLFGGQIDLYHLLPCGGAGIRPSVGGTYEGGPEYGHAFDGRQGFPCPEPLRAYGGDVAIEAGEYARPPKLNRATITPMIFMDMGLSRM